MSVQLVAQTIQLILAPVVLVTSIAIMVAGMLQLYSATLVHLRVRRPHSRWRLRE